MPRAPRVHFPGALFHAMARGNGGQQLFFDDRDYTAFLDILADVKAHKPFQLYAYCLMPNHFHLLIEPLEFPLSKIMQRLMMRFAKHFNIRRRRFGHVFQGRFKAILCQKDSYLLELLRYIHLNPVRAHLVENPADWNWSGHREYLGAAPAAMVDSRFPLSVFHADAGHARLLYSRFVQDGIGGGKDPALHALPSFPCLGDPSFEDDFRERMQKAGHADPVGKPASLQELGELVCGADGLAAGALRSASKLRVVVSAKRSFTLQAVAHGFRPSDIAAFLNLSPSAVSQTLARLKKSNESQA